MKAAGITPLFATRATFATMIDASTKHVDRLVRRGLPCIGSGKARRIDVERATAWLRDHGDAFVDPDELAGRRAAEREIARERRSGAR